MSTALTKEQIAAQVEEYHALLDRLNEAAKPMLAEYGAIHGISVEHLRLMFIRGESMFFEGEVRTLGDGDDITESDGLCLPIDYLTVEWQAHERQIAEAEKRRRAAQSN